MGMGDKKDFLKSDSNLPQDTSRNSFKRTPNEHRGNEPRKKICLGGSGRNFQNCFSTVIEPPGNKEVLLSHATQISSNEVSMSEKQPETLDLSENSATMDTYENDPLVDLSSFGDLETSLHALHNTNNLLQDQSNSLNYPDASVRRQCSFKPSYSFRDLLQTPNNNDVEEFSYVRRIVQSNFSMDVLSENEHIFRDTRTECENEGKLKDSTDQRKTWNIDETVNKSVIQNSSDQSYKNSYKWDKFLERWEGLDIISGSTSEAQHHEVETKEEPGICLQASSTSESRKRKESKSFAPFNGQTKKRFCTVKSPETVASSSKSNSSDEEHGSNRKFVLPSFENEMEILVKSVSQIKNTTIKLEKGQKPSILINGTNGSILSNNTKLMSLLEQQILSDGTNSSDKIKELTGVEEDPSLSNDDAEIIS